MFIIVQLTESDRVEFKSNQTIENIVIIYENYSNS